MYIGALKFSHSYFNVYVARVAPLGFFYTCPRSAPALLDIYSHTRTSTDTGEYSEKLFLNMALTILYESIYYNIRGKFFWVYT